MLDLPVTSIMEENVVTVGINDPVAKVQQVMSLGLSCIPVLDTREKCFGVISCSDLTHFELLERNPKIEKAWEICSHRVITIDVDTTIAQACSLLLEHGVHHLVVTRKQVIAGIISSLDLVRYLYDTANASSSA